MKHAMMFTFFVAAIGLHCPVHAQVTYDGCRDVRGIPVASIADFDLRDVANASLAPTGAPIIRYNPRVLAWLQPQTRLFFYAHECGHHALGHAFGSAFPTAIEQQADCFGIRTLVRENLVDDDGITIIQGDLQRAGGGDWTHLPGPQRAINLRACLGQTRGATPSVPSPRQEGLYCCDGFGVRRCMIVTNPGRLGSSCYCNGIPGVGRMCQ